MIRRRTITSYVWNSVSGNKMVILSNCIRNFFRKFELIGNSMQGENPSPDNPQEIKSAGWFDEASGKYLFDVKVTGKNLFDLKKIKKGFVTSTGNGFDIMESSVHPKSIYLDMVIPLKVGQTLNISGVEQDACRIRVKHDTGTSYYLKYTANKDTEIIICFYSGLTDENKKTILIEISDTPTNYEPYTEQAMQIVLDEPLRGIGEHKDVLTKDGVVRKIKRIVFDGGEDEKWALSNDPKNVTTNRFMIGMDTINTYYKIFTMCDKLSWGKANNVDLVGQTTHGKAFYVTMSKELAPNLEAFRTWLSQNPLTVDYVLAEPATEPLPESVQAQLQAMHSENGTTHVIIDSGEVECGINIEYKYKS